MKSVRDWLSDCLAVAGADGGVAEVMYATY
jgi:hypothetical protein